ncbi:MAG: efflux RND transporter permease subunit [Pirellula sp.]|jgi:predicted RND superfamily exporter protein
MIRFRWLGLSLATILFFVALPASFDLRLDRSMEAMFAKEDRIRTDFERLESIFGVSELIVFAYRDEMLWSIDGQGLERLQRIRQRIEALPGIDSAMDLTKVNGMLRQWNATMGLLSASKNNFKSQYPLLDANDAMAVKLKKLFEGQTHASRSDLVAIACILKRNGKSSDVPLPSHAMTIDQLRKIDLESDQSVLLAGQSVMVEEGFEAIEADGRRLGLFSALSLAGLLWIGFRSLRWALIVIAVVQWSLVVTRAVLVILDWELTMVSSMLASIVTVIGVATTMHWMLGYQRLCSTGADPELALQDSMRQLRRPIVWACVTDAIGFLSLTFAKVGPVQDYGWMMALASIVVLLAIFLIVPGLALIPLLRAPWDQRTGMQIPLYESPWLSKEMFAAPIERCKGLAHRYPGRIIATSIALGGIAVLGSLRIELETDFVKNFKASSPLVVAYETIERELGGAGVWDIAVPVPNSIQSSVQREIAQLEERLRSIRVGEEKAPVSLSHVMSVLDADEVVGESFIMKRLGLEGRLLAMKPLMGSFLGSLVGSEKNKDGQEQRYLRIMLRSREQVSAKDKRLLIDALRNEVQTYPENIKDIEREGKRELAFVSGYYVLLAELVSSIVADQWRCFAIAGIGILVATALALRDIRLACMALVPNVLPSLCILGWFGWSGIPMNLGAAMIAAVSMGLSVDSSIHYLSRYQQEIRRGQSSAQSVDSAQSEIGMAIVLSTLALILGFGALATSDFLPTVIFGVSAALSMAGGLIGNLILLPALLRYFSGVGQA